MRLMDQDAAMLLRFCRILAISLGVISAEANETRNTVRFYVDNHGWHTGIILPVREISADLEWSIARDFRRFDYIEIGWGHKVFYMSRRFNLGIAFTALFGVSPSVLHVCGVPGPPAAYFVESRVYQLSATRAEFRQLCLAIVAATKRDACGRAISLGPGLYGNSRFYEANGKYFMPKTCNYWTVARLRDAGYDVAPLLGLTAGGVCRQVRRLEREQGKSPVAATQVAAVKAR